MVRQPWSATYLKEGNLDRPIFELMPNKRATLSRHVCAEP